MGSVRDMANPRLDSKHSAFIYDTNTCTSNRACSGSLGREGQQGGPVVLLVSYRHGDDIPSRHGTQHDLTCLRLRLSNREGYG